MLELAQRHCKKELDISALSLLDISLQLQSIPNWSLDETHHQITSTFKFKNFNQTIAFVNAIVWVIEENDHHPLIDINYNQCRLSFSTHSVNGISIKDFICAAKINQITKETVD